MLLPGSWQGPSDPETMFMDLNEEKTAYIEHWKPIEEVKEILDEYIEVEVLEDLPTFTGMDAKNYTL